MSALSAEKLLATIKRERPAKCVVFVGDKERAVAVRGGRNFAAQTFRAIEAMGAWTRVELLNKASELLATIENSDPAGELQDIGATTGVAAQLERLLVIVEKSKERALAQREVEVRSFMQASTEMVRAIAEQAKQQAAMYERQLEVQRETEDIRTDAAAAAASDGDTLSQLLDAAPAILQMLPMLKQLMSGEAAPLPNGARKVS